MKWKKREKEENGNFIDINLLQKSEHARERKKKFNMNEINFIPFLCLKKIREI